jgi:hypothetical protein
MLAKILTCFLYTCRWNFVTEDNDITFGVYYSSGTTKKKLDENWEALVKPVRVNSHLVPEYGSIACDKKGKCLDFCNAIILVN